MIRGRERSSALAGVAGLLTLLIRRSSCAVAAARSKAAAESKDREDAGATTEAERHSHWHTWRRLGECPAAAMLNALGRGPSTALPPLRGGNYAQEDKASICSTLLNPTTHQYHQWNQLVMQFGL